MSDAGEDKDAKCTFFRARKRVGRNIRGRVTTRTASSSSGSSGEDSDEGNVAVLIRRKKRKPGVEATSGVGKKRATAQTSSSSDDNEEQPSKVGVTFKGSGSKDRTGPTDMGATATAEIDTDRSKDARAVEERAREQRDRLARDGDDKQYHGLKSYAKYIEKKDTAAGSAAKMSTGPQRAPANIRATVRWDYAPDICKDYKETGFCGFGDSCKFMHDRSDYKFGWQLEREMQEGTYGQDDEDPDKYEISSDEEDLPFKCFLCKESFIAPVVTKCKHYFCEKCALDHYRKSQRCFACGRQTNGVFNPAKDIIAKLEAAKKAEDAAKDSNRIVNDSDDSI